MKILIASDIHGSALYCEQLINAFRTENADKLLLLGDVLYHGPRNDLPDGYNPKKVIEILNNMAEKIICVRGNCEAEVDQMVLSFPVMSEYSVISIDGLEIFATHGHKINPENPPKLSGGALLLNGHTHIPVFKEINGFYFANPGSVSIPKENSERGYIILENKKLTFKNLEGSIYLEKEV